MSQQRHSAIVLVLSALLNELEKTMLTSKLKARNIFGNNEVDNHQISYYTPAVLTYNF